MQVTIPAALAQAISAGRLDEAISRLSTLLATDHRNVALWRLRGQLCHRKGDGAMAQESFQKALQLAPEDPENLISYADLLRDANAGQAAVNLYQKVLKSDASNSRALSGIADVLIKAGDAGRACVFLEKVLAAEPKNVSRWRQLGMLYLLQGNLAAAEHSYASALKLDPTSSEAAFQLGDVYFKLERIGEAISCYRRVVGGSLHEQAQVREVNCLLRQERIEDALARADALLTSGNSCIAELRALKASALIFAGRLEEAAVENDAALLRDSHFMQAWQNKVSLAPASFSQSDIELLNKIAVSGNDEERMRAWFVLADVWEYRKDYVQQMEALSSANAIAARLMPYDARAIDDFHARMARWYELHNHEPATVACDDDFVPVFVLGLPRSGTTLLEQALCGHPDVDGSGESLALLHALDGQAIESLLEKPESEWVPGFRQRYRDYQRARGFGARFVMDKGIACFRVAGLLWRAFPEAKFISIERHPLDLCLGGWKKLFNTGQSWVYTEDGLAHAIRGFRDILGVWSANGEFPLYSLMYEQLVDDTESRLQEICQHLGIELHEAMLRPEQQQRSVLTASTLQVRRKLNSNAVDRWKRYEGHLDKFVEALRRYQVEIPGID